MDNGMHAKIGVVSLAAALGSIDTIINRVTKQPQPEQPKAHSVKVYHSAEGPMRNGKAKRPAGMSGRQWKKARKAAGLSTKSEGFFRTKTVEEKTDA